MRRPNLKRLIKFIIISLVSLILFLLMTFLISKNFPHTKNIFSRQSVDKIPHEINVPPILKADNSNNNIEELESVTQISLRKDWHDYKTMYHDLRRIGLGEQGQPASLNDNIDRELEKKLSLEYGYSAMLSDAISLNRAVADVRSESCLHKQYLTKLPQVSIVIPFFNEYFSVLLRSLHSLLNRTPPELLKEIILVDDFSDNDDLGLQLDHYVAHNLKKVQILRLPERMGLIRARMAGLRKATGEALVIFDSHIEVNYNWLPPLLEPIAHNKRTVVCPLIDTISFNTFQYIPTKEGRGAFDWSFRYIRLKLLPEDLLDTSKPYKSPVMIGGLFAISAEFFWELGGYDEGLDVWGGEQFELSFKIWMCGGQLLDAPCSRVGHLYRDGNYKMKNPRKTAYIFKNLKRVAEVWMDEYKNYIYERRDGIFENTNEGDLTAQKALRQKLQCNSFKWYLEVIAFDLLKEYPPVEPPEYAYGAIQNVGATNFCLDTLSNPLHSIVGLYYCAQNLTSPQSNQYFVLTWLRDLRLRRTYTCLEVLKKDANATVSMWTCHAKGGNQFWYYDRENKWIIYEKNGNRCLEASVSNKYEVYVNTCVKGNLYMQWNFGVVNDTALDGFFENL